MAKFAIPRLLSVLLVAGYAPMVQAQTPTEDEPGLETTLPGLLDEVPEDDAAVDEPAEGDDTAGADAAESFERGEEDDATPPTDGDLEEGAGAGDVAGEEPALPGRRPKNSAKNSAKNSKKKGKGKRPSSGKSGKRSTSGKSKSGKKSASSSRRSGSGKSGKKSKKSSSGKPGTKAKSGKSGFKSVKSTTRPKGAKECDYRTPIYEHEVVKGENLGAIAGRYGVRRADIVGLNPRLKKNPNLLRPGQKLRVCPEITPHSREAIEHVVAKGENPTKIAKRYGITAEELIGLQKGKLKDRLTANARSLRAGDRLVVLVDVEAQPEFAPAEVSTGVLRASVKLSSDSKHYLVKRPNLAYGTARTIKAIKAAISRYKQRKPRGPRVHVGDISKKGGGKLKPHRSHQKGVDVDIGLVHKGMLAGEKRFVAANPQTLDVARTWALIKAFADTKEVRAVFLDYDVQKTLYEYARRTGVRSDTLDELFQYPRGKGHAHGLIRHWRGHKNHFHVRFRG